MDVAAAAEVDEDKVAVAGVKVGSERMLRHWVQFLMLHWK